ncbi:hypothetical protein Trydic_g2217 [Trypoxylus dichotomus]
MTVNCYCISNNSIRTRLPFGVPLDDIFPSNDIHPYLKTIFSKAYHDITLNKYSVEEVISKLQGTIAERLLLKEVTVSCKPMPSGLPPGVLLWILRHFIGLLPLPLLPEYTNGQHFSWKRLAQFCKRSFMKYTTIEVNNRLLICKLAEELSRLPHANLLLLTAMLNFVRALARERCGSNIRNFNRLEALYLVRYFSSSIFLRPYNPGRVSKVDRHYFPLLLYLVLKWPAIKKHFEANARDPIPFKNSVRESIAVSPSYYPKPAEKILKIKDSYAQTDDYVHFESCSEIASEDNCFKSVSQNSQLDDYLEAVSEVENNECAFLRDTGCQTEEIVQKPKNIKDYFFRDGDIRCCCTYGNNYESCLNEYGSLDKYCQTNLNDTGNKSPPRICSKTDASTSTDKIMYKLCLCDLDKKSIKTPIISRRNIGVNTDDLCYYDWISSNQSPKSTLKRSSLCSPQTFISNNDYMYDDYTDSTLNLIRNIEETKSLQDENDVLGRIAKIGWTYTPPRSTAPTSPLVSPKTMSKTGLKEENCIVCCNDKEQLSKEDKENCSSTDSLKSKRSVSNVSFPKSRKSFTVANIKSKLDFFKIFGGKKDKLKGSCSFDEISNIKYKKMNSVRSTLF